MKRKHYIYEFNIPLKCIRGKLSATLSKVAKTVLLDKLEMKKLPKSTVITKSKEKCKEKECKILDFEEDIVLLKTRQGIARRIKKEEQDEKTERIDTNFKTNLVFQKATKRKTITNSVIYIKDHKMILQDNNKRKRTEVIELCYVSSEVEMVIKKGTEYCIYSK